MEIATMKWTMGAGWSPPAKSLVNPQLVLYFGSTSRMGGKDSPVIELTSRFPGALICGCSTSGEILENHVWDESIVAAIVQFDSVQVRAGEAEVSRREDCMEIGRQLGARLAAADLRHVMVLSDGLVVNGTELVEGFRGALPPDVAITGGLAGDGSRFEQTFVGLGRNVGQNRVVAIGFYGEHLKVGFGSRHGWEAFGPRRRITRAQGSTLYELDGSPALALYKRYLGERAAGLPATGLLFPLELMRNLAESTGVVRTILAVDEAQQSLTFAGDMPEGCYVRLMKASTDQLVEGSASAARDAVGSQKKSGTLAIMVSCVGRRLVLGQRIEDEVEAAIRAMPDGTETLGFYSYGEVCPGSKGDSGELHNQTMTITIISEE